MLTQTPRNSAELQLLSIGCGTKSDGIEIQLPMTTNCPPQDLKAPSLRIEPTPDVLIVGGGILGLSCAEALAASGLKVELWERRVTPGAAASGASAGMLAPLAEVPDDPDFFAICRAARDEWLSFAPRLSADTGLDLDYDCSGALVADHPELPSDLLRATAEHTGEPWQELDRAQATYLIPDLSPHIDRWLHLAGEHRVDNRKVCEALVARLGNLGVTLRTEQALCEVERRATGVVARSEKHQLEVPEVILAAGAWSGAVPGLPPLPVHPVKGQMLRFDDVSWPFEGCLRAGHGYAARRRQDQRQSGDNRGGLIVGATMEPEAGFDTTVTGGGVASLLDFVKRIAPGLLSRPLTSTWAGLRPGSFDGKPLLGPVDDGIWAATGHYRNGILLAPLNARFLTSWLLEGKATDPAIAALFDPLRAQTSAADEVPQSASRPHRHC